MEVFKNAESLVILVADPAEDLQVFLSTARMRLEVILDLPSIADPSEVASLALHPGEGGEIGAGAGEDNLLVVVLADPEVLQLEMSVDILQGGVVEPLGQLAQLAGEGEVEMISLDVRLSSCSLAYRVSTVGTQTGVASPGSHLPLPLPLPLVSPVFVQESSPQTEVSRPGQLILAQLAAQHDLLLVVPNILRVEFLEMVLDDRHVGLVSYPQPGTAQRLI